MDFQGYRVTTVTRVTRRALILGSAALAGEWPTIHRRW